MNIDFTKSDGLIPVIIQNSINMQVLMLGYMNEEAFLKSKEEGRVTFFSRCKNRLWTKGETSGNYLNIKGMHLDCDQDTLLISVLPEGPVCHTGSVNCFNTEIKKGFIYDLESNISQRIDENVKGSYTNELFNKGINKVAQKVGEEAVELVIEAKDDNDHLFLNEAADLMYHYLVLLKAKGFEFSDVEEILISRQKNMNFK